MLLRRLWMMAALISAMGLAVNLAWGLGLELGETKDQLKLKYDVSMVDHGTGRVTFQLTMHDEGRLKPLSSVDLLIPSQDKTGYADLVLSLAPQKSEGKSVTTVHLKKEWAERAVLHLRTSTLDGKVLSRTWYYHPVPLAKFLKGEPAKK